MNHKESVGDVVQLTWFKSTYSDSSNPSDCVEVAMTPATIHVRDSKNKQSPRLALAPAAWADFVAFAGRD